MLLHWENRPKLAEAPVPDRLIYVLSGRTVVGAVLGEMMRFVIFCVMFLMASVGSWAQENLVVLPVDEAAEDASFFSYRSALLSAVIARDTEAVIALSSPDISLSFGGSEGHGAFRDRLNTPIDTVADKYRAHAPKLREAYWTELETALKMGGRFVEGAFYAPYTWLAPEPANTDPYDVYYVVGNNVRMRTAGHGDAPIKRHLSYNAVEIYPWDENSGYQEVRLPDGTEGFVSVRFLRSLLAYRAIFRKENGHWRMTGFQAGD